MGLILGKFRSSTEKKVPVALIIWTLIGSLLAYQIVINIIEWIWGNNIWGIGYLIRWATFILMPALMVLILTKHLPLEKPKDFMILAIILALAIFIMFFAEQYLPELFSATKLQSASEIIMP